MMEIRIIKFGFKVGCDGVRTRAWTWNSRRRPGVDSDAREASFPPGHDGARQALRDLRRMIDPEWDRIRRAIRDFRKDKIGLE